MCPVVIEKRRLSQLCDRLEDILGRYEDLLRRRESDSPGGDSLASNGPTEKEEMDKAIKSVLRQSQSMSNLLDDAEI